jgi:EmrB/QacA subfamily drug resistance transporter
MAELTREGNGGGTAPTPTQQWTLLIVCVGTFMLMLDVTAVAIALKSVGVSLDASFSDVQWVIDAYTLTLAALLLTSGSLADRLGRKRMFLVGLVIFTLASLVIGASPDIGTMIVARGVQGVGAAVMYAVGPALIGQEFQGPARGAAFGALGGVAGLAIAIGPLIGGFLTSGESWRWLFLINVPIGVFALLASVKKLRESSHPQAHPIDWLGTATFAVGLGLLVFGLLRSGAEGWSEPLILGSVAGGLGLLVVFLLIELRRGRAAMFDLSLFRIRSFAGVTVATLLSNAAVVSAIILQLFYMQSALGHSAWQTGLRFIPQTFTIFFVAMWTGTKLMARVSPGALIGLSIALIAVGTGLAALVTPGGSWIALLPCLVVTGVGMGMFNPPRAAVTIGVVEPARAGMANGMGESFQQVGVAVGIAVFGAMFQREVVSTFASSEVGRQLGDQAQAIGHLVVVNGAEGAASQVPPALAGATRTAAEAAFVHGFVEIMLVCGAVAAVGSIIAYALIRRRDLHASALGPDPAAAGAEAPAAGAPAPPAEGDAAHSTASSHV